MYVQIGINCKVKSTCNLADYILTIKPVKLIKNIYIFLFRVN